MPGEPRVLRRVERAAQLLSRHLGRELGDGLTDAEAHVLFHLKHLPQGTTASIRDLRRTFGLRPSTLTAVVDRLERQGLVERRPNPADRRSLLVEPTAKAEAAVARVAAVIDGLEKTVRDEVSGRDLAGFIAVLDALETALE